MTNAERQAKWVKKNRALFNLRRRNARRNLGSGVGSRHTAEPTESVIQSDSVEIMKGNEASSNDTIGAGGAVRFGTHGGGSVPPAQTSKDETLAKLRDLVKQEEEKTPTEEPRKPTDVVGGIYRNDFGGIISKMAWEKLQKKKEDAKEGGYTLDEYSQ